MFFFRYGLDPCGECADAVLAEIKDWETEKRLAKHERETLQRLYKDDQEDRFFPLRLQSDMAAIHAAGHFTLSSMSCTPSGTFVMRKCIGRILAKDW